MHSRISGRHVSSHVRGGGGFLWRPADTVGSRSAATRRSVRDVVLMLESIVAVGTADLAMFGVVKVLGCGRESESAEGAREAGSHTWGKVRRAR